MSLIKINLSNFLFFFFNIFFMVVLFFVNVNLGGVYFLLLCLFYLLFSTSFYKSKLLYLFIINISCLNVFYILFNLELKNFIFYVVKVLVIILPLLISIAYFTLVERKVLGFMQRRRGPNVVGFFGLLQPIADGVKLIFKETIVPTHANKVIFFWSPILTFTLSLTNWINIPFNEGWVYADIKLSVLCLYAISSLGVYGIICAGWSSNSKYAFLGALRSAAQMISYEVSFGLILITVLFCSGSLNFSDIVLSQTKVWYILPLLPAFLMFFISALAETNRPPFDLPEAEAELVSGYNVEYSSLIFALFFLAEYLNMLLMSALITTLFLGGWLPVLDIIFLNWLPGVFWFSFKLCCLVFLFVWVRAAFPRLRYDQLMFLGWKVFLPLSLGYLVFLAGIMYTF